ncbi:MAG: alkaline phosphatase family protein [Candidatus Binatia bacterium]
MRLFWLALAAALLIGCATDTLSSPASDRRVVILGFDGLDPNLLERFIGAGELPNFAKLAARGVHRFGTTVPPQSPVAWSTFITGLDPGSHGIFDFIHRDPKPPGTLAVLPFLSTSKAEEEEPYVTVGDYQLPRAGKVELLRRGKAFWNVLVEHGIPATVVKIPANFPPEPSEARTLSDMGTPDLRGTYGTFLFYTSDPADGAERSVSGGLIYRVAVRDGRARGSIPGPESPFLKKRTRLERDFEVWVDAESDAAKIEIGGESLLLQTGEWSDWVPVRFDLVPGLADVGGMVRFHLMAVKPHLRLYTTPVNIDPLDPALPISTPDGYVEELAARAGRFYTQGLPENTASLTAGMLDDAGFLDQAKRIYEERMRLLETELARFDHGFLFVYFGGADQVAHMFWRTLEADHPAGGSPGHENAIRDVYRELDVALGRTLEALGPKLDETTLLVLSDHGFSSFRRAVHLNSWLRDAGFLRLRAGRKTGGELFRDVDWSQTKAYAVGLNGLYLNLQGRERYGIVPPPLREKVLAELGEKLLALRDPANGKPVVARAYRREEIYAAPDAALAPDIVVGYASGYRVSDASALGEIPELAIEDNKKKWSGDHCMAADLVPGVLLANREVVAEAPGLVDVAPTVLALFGVEPPKEMLGKPFLR